MNINVTVFDDKNKDGIYNTGDTPLSEKYITLRNAADNTCQSVATDANGVAQFTGLLAGDYFVYETFQNITDTHDDSYFDSLYVDQPINGYTSTTPRKFKVTITNADKTVNFGHCSYSPVDCSAYAYLIVNPGDSSYLASILLGNGDVNKLKTYENMKLNALAYNYVEQLLYCTTFQSGTKGLYRIEGGPNYQVYRINRIINSSDYSDWSPDYRYIATADQKGTLYFATSNQTEVSKVNMDAFSLNYLYATKLNITGLAGSDYADWAIDSVNNVIYYYDRTKKKVVKVNLNVSPPTVTDINTDSSAIKDNGYFMVGAFYTNDGYLYLLSSTGRVYRVNLYTAEPVVLEYFSELSQKELSINGDGANCSIKTVALDFGNAPESSAVLGTAAYKTTLAKNGPRHIIKEGKPLTLGVIEDPEADAIIGATVWDNDSTAFPLTPMDKEATQYYLPVTCKNTSVNDATLYAWLDFNTNGMFEVAEIKTYPVPNTGLQTINVLFERPTGYTSTLDKTFVRLRLTSDTLDKGTATANMEDPRSLSLTGAASDGEDEDYLLELKVTPDVRCLKEIDNDDAKGGDPIKYTITVTNYGSVTVNDVTVTDDLTEILKDTTLKNAEYTTTNNTTPTQVTADDLMNGVNVGSLSKNQSAVFIIDLIVN